MGVGSGSPFVQLNVIQFYLSDIWIRNALNAFYSTFSIHVDLWLDVVVVLDIHNILVGRINTRSSFHQIITFRWKSQVGSNARMKVFGLCSTIAVLDATLGISISDGVQLCGIPEFSIFFIFTLTSIGFRLRIYIVLYHSLNI